MDTLDVGHGNPTMFREWWKQHSVCPTTISLEMTDYEYHDNTQQLISSVRELHQLFDTDCPSATLLLGNGSTHVIYSILMAISSELDRPIIVGYSLPVYMYIDELIHKSKFIIVTHDLERDDLDVELIIDPNNPTGENQDRRSTAKYVIYDRAYNWPIYVDNVKPTSSRNDEITVYTLSKCLGVGGLRIGWAFVNDDKLSPAIERCLMLSSMCINTLGLRASHEVIQNLVRSPTLQQHYRDLRYVIQQRRQRLADVGTLCVSNTQGPYAWITFNQDSSANIANYLLENFRIKVVCGTAFRGEQQYARMTLICTDDEFDTAIIRLSSHRETYNI